MASQSSSSPLRRAAAVVCDVEGSLLRSSSCFPYFMVVAIEAGSFLRGLLLLLLYPLLLTLSEDARIRAMAFISFCGLRVSSFHVGSAVLPKHLLVQVGRDGFQLLMKGEKKVCVTLMPRVMVEECLIKYLGVDVVVAREMKAAFGFYTGLMTDNPSAVDAISDKGVLSISRASNPPLHPFFSRCEEMVAVTEEEKAKWGKLAPEEYPEPLVFQDGRLTFPPTPAAMAAVFVWLPFGAVIAGLRFAIIRFFPYGVSTAALAFTGMKTRLVRSPFIPKNSKGDSKGRLFVCNHKSQLDHMFISLMLGLPAFTLVNGISLSSRLLSPLRPVVLKREREEDKVIMAVTLRRGDVILSPEGTTCREPFLLRFSPLFAELVDEVRPVAQASHPSMFHGTSVNGWKTLDPFFSFANPLILLTGEFLKPLQARGIDSRETANGAQKAIAAALGYRCTMLTKKDKYRYLGCHGKSP
ncbi:putative glycerol-3-phosphate acyltransferase 2 [Wolffia australiana]